MMSLLRKCSKPLAFYNYCANVENADDKHLLTIQFLAEQLMIRNAPHKMYGTNIFLWVYHLFITSSKTYDFLRKSVFILPIISYLRHLTSCLSLSNIHLSYLKKKAEPFEPHERILALLLDEIHVPVLK